MGNLPPTPRPFRLLALDLDGTLLSRAEAALSGQENKAVVDRWRVSKEDARALRQFAEGGGIIVLASGRMTANIRPIYDQLGLDGPTIAYNGARARESRAAGEGVILETALPASYADELLDYTARERFHLNYYYQEKLYARDDQQLRRYADFYSQQTGAVFEFLPDLTCFRGLEPTKLLLVTDPSNPDQPNPRHRDELYAVWQARWGSRVTVMRTNPEYLEFYHREADKGRALAAIAAHYDIPQHLTLALGDNFNDVSMLQWAGCGVAVANANADAIDAADWVSPRSNNESAVADALARLLSTGSP